MNDLDFGKFEKIMFWTWMLSGIFTLAGGIALVWLGVKVLQHFGIL